MDSAQDRNLPATPQRLKKAREEGQVPRSRDLAHLVVLGGGMLVLSVLAPWAYSRLREGLRQAFVFDHDLLRQQPALTGLLGDAVGNGLLAFLPLGVLVALLVVAATVASGGYAYSTKPLMPDLSKLNPLAGFGRLFSKQQAVEVLKLTAITALMALLAALYLRSHLQDFASLLLRPLEAGVGQLLGWLVDGVTTLLAVVLVIALIDVPLQHVLYRQRLKMSLQEVKDEHKESDGNPQLKGKLRQRQREIAMGNSVRRVPEADLVVMNPTHYAVALKYDDSMVAPQVIAKGTDLIALRIRDMAREHQVPVLEAPPLARALFAHTELEQQVPAALFTAVAQVLAYVYQLRAALRGEGPMPGQAPQPEVPLELDPHHARATTTA